MKENEKGGGRKGTASMRETGMYVSCVDLYISALKPEGNGPLKRIMLTWW
jgi:hypothetical protein